MQAALNILFGTETSHRHCLALAIAQSAWVAVS
jgi:hypothetical protein